MMKNVWQNEQSRFPYKEFLKNDEDEATKYTLYQKSIFCTKNRVLLLK